MSCASAVRARRDCRSRRGIVWGMRVGLPASARIGPVAQWLEPTAHNGLVGGSNPPGPTIFNALRVRTLFDRSRMFAFSSRISLVNRWSKLEAHLVRDEGVAGSNPATPTILSTV